MTTVAQSTRTIPSFQNLGTIRLVGSGSTDQSIARREASPETKLVKDFLEELKKKGIHARAETLSTTNVESSEDKEEGDGKVDKTVYIFSSKLPPQDFPPFRLVSKVDAKSERGNRWKSVLSLVDARGNATVQLEVYICPVHAAKADVRVYDNFLERRTGLVLHHYDHGYWRVKIAGALGTETFEADDLLNNPTHHSLRVHDPVVHLQSFVQAVRARERRPGPAITMTPDVKVALDLPPDFTNLTGDGLADWSGPQRAPPLFVFQPSFLGSKTNFGYVAAYSKRHFLISPLGFNPYSRQPTDQNLAENQIFSNSSNRGVPFFALHPKSTNGSPTSNEMYFLGYQQSHCHVPNVLQNGCSVALAIVARPKGSAERLAKQLDVGVDGWEVDKQGFIAHE